jgi:hypothetical protein
LIIDDDIIIIFFLIIPVLFLFCFIINILTVIDSLSTLFLKYARLIPVCFHSRIIATKTSWTARRFFVSSINVRISFLFFISSLHHHKHASQHFQSSSILGSRLLIGTCCMNLFVRLLLLTHQKRDKSTRCRELKCLPASWLSDT